MKILLMFILSFNCHGNDIDNYKIPLPKKRPSKTERKIDFLYKRELMRQYQEALEEGYACFRVTRDRELCDVKMPEELKESR